MGCPLFSKSLEIPRQMGYLNQYIETTAVTHESMNLTVDNLRRLL